MGAKPVRMVEMNKTQSWMCISIEKKRLLRLEVESVQQFAQATILAGEACGSGGSSIQYSAGFAWIDCV